MSAASEWLLYGARLRYCGFSCSISTIRLVLDATSKHSCAEQHWFLTLADVPEKLEA